MKRFFGKAMSGLSLLGGVVCLVEGDWAHGTMFAMISYIITVQDSG